MKFYIFKKESLSYEKFNFLKPKILLWAFIIQLCIASLSITIISSIYNTPKEKRLQNDIIYLLEEYDALNHRIMRSDAILQDIMEHDSIIYQSIFDINSIERKSFEIYYKYPENLNYDSLVSSANKRISALDKRLAKQAFSLDFMVKKAYSHQERLVRIPAIQPVDNKDLKRTASGWGYRIHPIYKIRKFHYGIDFTAKTGTPIYATGNGTIQYAIKARSKASKGYGNLIIMDHGYGYKTLYAHMHRINVKQGQEVKRGEIIGFVGSTGISTGPHLHYEVIKNGRKVNPVHYFFNDLTPEEYQKIIEISNSIKKSYD